MDVQVSVTDALSRCLPGGNIHVHRLDAFYYRRHIYVRVGPDRPVFGNSPLDPDRLQDI